MSVAFDAAMVSGLPLNVPAMSYSSSTTGRYSSRVAPIAPHGQAAADRLRQAHDVRRHAERLDGAAERDRGPRLHLVERQVRAVLVREILEPLQVAGLGQDHAAVHHRRLDDHAGDLALVLLERARGLGQVVERHHPHDVRHRLRDAERLRHGVRMLPGADLRGIGTDGEHQRVVVPVIRALDLDDHLAAGVGAHEARGLERGLRAGVAEPPEREAEAFDQVVADRVQVLRGLREVRAALDLPLDRLDDLRVRVAGDHGAVAQVEVEVLVAVDVPQPVAQAVVDVDRVRRRGLPAGGDTSGDRASRDLAIRDRCAVLRFELRFLIRDQGVYPIEVDVDRLVDDHGFRLLAKNRRSPRDDPRALD